MAMEAKSQHLTKVGVSREGRIIVPPLETTAQQLAHIERSCMIA
eukprot:SAG22_NODE_2910_length_2110_cov_1.295375_3_plen_44_part_00